MEMYFVLVRPESLAHSPPSLHLGKLGSGSFVTCNSSDFLALLLSILLFRHLSSTPPIYFTLLQEKTLPALVEYLHTFNPSTPALSRCPASTSPTTTATRLFTPGASPSPKPPALVPQLWDVFTIRALWYEFTRTHNPMMTTTERRLT
jgi:hypothetical protein